MPKGYPSIKKQIEKVCGCCEEVFVASSVRRKYCDPCRTNKPRSDRVPWSIWSLNYRQRLKKLTQMAKNRALSKKIGFNLDHEYIETLWESTGGRCQVTGREFDLTSWGKKGQVNPNAPSIDRIKPELGYVKGNVRLVIYHLNIALSDFGEDLFKDLCKDFLKGGF